MTLRRPAAAALFFLAIPPGIPLAAQTLRLLPVGPDVSLRGLCPVTDRVLWVSGSSGTFGRSVDGGATWNWQRVAGFDSADFRDVEGFSAREAVLMGITHPAVFLETTDGGRKWQNTFDTRPLDPEQVFFFDAMDFRGREGIALGDPPEARAPRPYLPRRKPGAVSWLPPEKTNTVLDSGEAFFASSGNNIRWIGRGPGDADSGGYAFVSGGTRARLFFRGKVYPLDLLQGRESTGANALAPDPVDPNRAFVVGGDFKRDTVSEGNAVRITLFPFSERRPVTPPHGYRSCVEYLDSRRMICCGTSGVDVSEDGGMNWRLISSRPFHVCRKSKTGQTIFLAGPHGALAELVWP